MPALTFDGVSHRYGTVLAVDGVSFTVDAGETVCLLGPSGCGKSTLLRLAAGLERTQAGSIAIGERVVAAAGMDPQVPPEARGVGLVFQDYALFPHLTAVENIRYGLSGGRREGEARARRFLADIGMTELAGRYPHALSGGQQQRVALLRALAPKPRVTLLDEPFSTLDEHLRHEVRMETMNLLAHSDAAAVLVTHDAEEALLLADRVMVMREGRIVQDATPDEVYSHPADLFTARLFGPVNRYEGTVRDGLVRTLIGPVQAPRELESKRVDVVVRADGIELRGLFSARGGAVRVRVRSVRRLGAWTLVFMTPRDATREAAGAAESGERVSILARLPGMASVASGDELALHARPEQTFVFPAGGGRA